MNQKTLYKQSPEIFQVQKNTRRMYDSYLRYESYLSYESSRIIFLTEKSQIEVEASFSDKFDKIDRNSRVEEGFADEESGYHRDILNSGWIQIGLGSSNNTAADLKSCQNSSYKRCIGVLRKSYPNILQGDAPQEVTVSVTGEGTERKTYNLTFDLDLELCI